jgi:hypothetical protein
MIAKLNFSQQANENLQAELTVMHIKYNMSVSDRSVAFFAQLVSICKTSGQAVQILFLC